MTNTHKDSYLKTILNNILMLYYITPAALIVDLSTLNKSKINKILNIKSNYEYCSMMKRVLKI